MFEFLNIYIKRTNVFVIVLFKHFLMCLKNVNNYCFIAIENNQILIVNKISSIINLLIINMICNSIY